MTRHKSLRSLELLVEEGDNVTVTFTLVNRAVAAMLLKSILDAAVVQFSVLVLCCKVLLENCASFYYLLSECT